jgi:hypothetical protein
MANRCFENVAKFRYLGTTIINQTLIQKEIKRRLNSGKACYHSAHNVLSFRLLSKNVKITIFKTIIFACGSVLVRQRMFEMVLRRIFGPK